MLQENEVVMLMIGAGVLVFMLINRAWIKQVPAHGLFFSAFGVLFSGWVFTVVEGFLLPVFFNFLEHLCYAGSSVLLVFWCRCLFREGKEESRCSH